MALPPEMVAAHNQLDAAVTALLTASGDFRNGEIVTGYTLIIAGLRFDDDPDEDEHETTAIGASYHRRGQDPHLTRGLIEAYLDEIRAPGREDE